MKEIQGKQGKKACLTQAFCVIILSCTNNTRGSISRLVLKSCQER